MTDKFKNSWLKEGEDIKLYLEDKSNWTSVDLYNLYKIKGISRHYEIPYLLEYLKSTTYQLQFVKFLSNNFNNYTKKRLVKDSNEKQYCLITDYTILNNIKDELYGFFIQSFLSLNRINAFGFNCNYICKCYDFGEYHHPSNAPFYKRRSLLGKKRVYGLLEYVEGNNLFDEINKRREQRKYFSETEILQIIGRLLIAVNEMNNYDFVHLNINPKNILIYNEDIRDIRLTGFEFARTIYGYETESTLPDAGINFGTLGYIAPELIRNNEYSKRSDMWSVGVIMINLLLLTNDLNMYMTDGIIRVEEVLKQLRNTSGICHKLLTYMLNYSKKRRIAEQYLKDVSISNGQRTVVLGGKSLLDEYLPTTTCFEENIAFKNENTEESKRKICKQFSTAEDYAGYIMELQTNPKTTAGSFKNCSKKELKDKYHYICVTKEKIRKQREEKRKREQEQEKIRKQQEEEIKRRQEEKKRKQQEKQREIEDKEKQIEKEEIVIKDCPCGGKQPQPCENKKDYLRQTRTFHPDRNIGCPNISHRKFQELTRLCSGVINVGGKKINKKTKKLTNNKKTNKKRRISNKKKQRN